LFDWQLLYAVNFAAVVPLQAAAHVSAAPPSSLL
jgi:hypothetical protein